MNVLAKTVAGSHLYGTDVSGSDEDYKVIFLPSKHDILLGRGKDASHVKAEDDVVSWSFQKWINLLLKMDSNAYEVIFAPIVQLNGDYVKFLPDESKILVDIREPAIGFVGSSLTRYALRGDRLQDFIAVVSVLSKYKTIEDSLEELATIEAVKFYNDPMGVKMISLHGKSYPVPGPINEAIRMFNKYVSGASKRAQEAIESHDWKGIAHGYRIASQMLELVRSGTVIFPLVEADTILKIRTGKIDIDTATQMVEDKVQELREEPESSYLLPQRDQHLARDYAEELIYNIHYEYVTNG